VGGKGCNSREEKGEEEANSEDKTTPGAGVRRGREGEVGMGRIKQAWRGGAGKRGVVNLEEDCTKGRASMVVGRFPA
jgi:hypothetical protein